MAGTVVEGWTSQTSGWQHPNDTDTTDSSGRYSLILREFGPGGYACWQDSARIQVSRNVGGGSDTAEFLGLGGQYGGVAPRVHADLVLLGANPLDDVEAVRDIRGVILRGEYLDRARLDALLEQAETATDRPFE